MSLRAISIACSSVSANFSCAMAPKAHRQRMAIIIGRLPTVHIFFISLFFRLKNYNYFHCFIISSPLSVANPRSITSTTESYITLGG